jgi:tight adherence protein B
MTALVVLGCGLAVGSGLLLILLGLYGTTPQPDEGEDSKLRLWLERLGAGGNPPAGGDGFAAAGTGTGAGAQASGVGAVLGRRRWRLTLALVTGLAMWLVTGWPVGILLAAALGMAAPSLVGAKAKRQAVVERTEAIAAWAEQLRDTINAAAGLQEAVAVTARVAPSAIRPAVVDLAAGMRRNSLPVELHRFADRLADPVADQVVALLLASERRGDDLSKLLGDLADGARADATMRIRTETSRAQTYNDAKVVTGVVVGMFVFMLVANRRYLDAFDSWTGQGVLAVIGVLWLTALYGITTLSQVRRPPRLLAVNAGLGSDAIRGGG